MGWTTPRTWASGEVVTAALLNTHLRDNLLETAPGLVTTDGDMVVATGAGALKRMAFGDSNDRILHERGGLEADVSAITTGGTVVGQSSGVIGVETAMTQVQAEAGSDTQVRGVTAQRMSQAIAALASGEFLLQLRRAFVQIVQTTNDGQQRFLIALHFLSQSGRRKSLQVLYLL